MNRKEYNRAVKEHSSNLYGFVFGFLRDEEDSRDIVQDAFEKLWKNRKKVESEKCKAWLFRTGYNTMINFTRKKSRTIYDVEMIHDRGYSDFQYEYQEIVRLTLATLPPTQKSILLLKDLEGYAYNEIAEILEISETQVKVYLYRARKKIKKQVGNLINVE